MWTQGGITTPLRALVREHLPFLALAGTYIGAWYPAQFVLGLDPGETYGWREYFGELTSVLLHDLLPIALLFYLLAYILRPGREPGFHPGAIARDFGSRYLTIRALGGLLIVYLVIPVFLGHFRAWKTVIPQLVPFAWDERFMALDHVLHGGHHPWEILQAIIGFPSATLVIDGLYVGWFALNFAVLLWMAVSARRFLRARFLLSYLLVYILIGTVAATAFSSVGPVYYGQIVGSPDPYLPLLDYLRKVGETNLLFVLSIQDTLWSVFQGSATSAASGISAMPSVHVAISVLFVFLGFSVHRLAGWGFLLFALAIFVGSIHLAWHYAVDGYAAALGTGLIWWGVGRFLRRYGGRWGLAPGGGAG